MKGDYERKSPVTTFKVVDEVSAVVGETRYALERLRFEGGTYAIRAVLLDRGRTTAPERIRVASRLRPVLPDAATRYFRRSCHAGFREGLVRIGFAQRELPAQPNARLHNRTVSDQQQANLPVTR